MATSSGDINKGCDIVYDFECQLCSGLGYNNEAEHFCSDCKQYLCKRCCAYHKVLPVTQGHEIISVQDKQCKLKDMGSIVFTGALCDYDTSWVTGLAMMPNNKLVVAQKGRTTKLKVFDVTIKQVVSEIELPRAPNDVTMISDDTVAVTVPDTREIVLVRTVPKLAIAGNLNVNGESFGLSFNADKGWLAVSFVMPPKVEIMDLTGRIIRTIPVGTRDVRRLVDKPWYVSFAADNKALFVACENGAVMKFGLDGRALSTYKDSKLIRPGGMVASRAGDVYITGIDKEFRLGYNIHIITSDCKKIKDRDIELVEEESLFNKFYCFCLCLNEEEGDIFVGTYGRGVVRAELKNL